MSDPLKELKVGSSTYEIYDEVARTTKQDTLVSGTNIKTINGESLLGSGDVSVSGVYVGHLDSTSTSTAMTAQISGITSLTDGTTILLKNGVVTSANNVKLNVNSLGAKPIYQTQAANSSITTQFNSAYTALLVYDSTRVSGGAWMYVYGYDSNTNTIGYQLRTNSTVMKVSDTARYYKIYFTSADGTLWVPASVNSTNNATSARPVNQRPIDPWGRIVYTSANTNYTAGSNLAATTIWDQYNISLGYSFNRTGSALTLTTQKPVYVKCAPQADGSAIMDADTPIVQALPTTNDGKIYIFLGIATSATTIEIVPNHPVYYYKDGIRLWTSPLEGAKIYRDTVSGWNAQTTLISEENAIYVYTDYDTDSQGNVVPGIKIGDGLAYLIDMPFVDEVMQEHIADTVIHVTQADKDNWNNKVSVQYVGNETIQFDI